MVLLSSLQPCFAAANLDDVVKANAAWVPKDHINQAELQDKEKDAADKERIQGEWSALDVSLARDPLGAAKQRATGAATEAAQRMLNQFGSAKLSLGAGDGFKNGSLDVLLPLRDTDSNLTFTQLGFRRSNALSDSYRSTLNIGVGHRHFFNGGKWMIGGNAFFDHDISRDHLRGGLGLEAWTDYLRLSANAYLRMSGWQDSPDIRGYMERPANGWDVRAEGYLPAFPHLGARLYYEQYYGQKVGLFGTGSLQRNPHAITVGLTYQPIPLFSLDLDYRAGQGGVSQTTVRANLTYKIGVPLDKQLRASSVRDSKLLKGSRYELVNRNNEIVLEYQKKEARLTIPTQISGYPGTSTTFAVNSYTALGFSSFAWTGTAASFVQSYSGGTATLALPSYNQSGTNTYTLQAVATETDGAVARSNVMTVTVNPLSVSLDRSKPTASADGRDSVTFTATVIGTNSEPLADQAVDWKIPASATVVSLMARTNKAGKADAIVTAKSAAVIHVTATSTLSGETASNSAAFIGDPTTAGVATLVAQPTAIAANGTSKSILTATLKDAKGITLGYGVPVKWATTLGTLSADTSVTDSNGQAVVTLTSATTAGTATVTASAIAGNKTADVAFTPDVATANVASLTAAPAAIPANGASKSTLTATIKDANGNTVGAGIPVKWQTTAGTLSAANSQTDTSGVAIVTLTSATAAGIANVTATTTAGNKTAPVAFVPDTATAGVVSLVANPTSIAANGSSTSALTATVKDASGNTVGAGVTVNWSTSAGSLTGTSSVTDASGIATMTLKSATTVGVATVSATAVAGSKTANVTFVPDTATAGVVSLVANPTSIAANGSSTSTLTATVKDAYGNAVGAGVTVNWSTSAGSLTGTSSVTDASGIAMMTLKSATTAGTATVTAAAVAGSKTANVTFVPDMTTAAVVSLAANPTSIAANGSSTSALTATVKDGNGNAMGAGVTVNWTTTAGSLAGTSSVTDASGIATMTLKSATTVGVATVTAAAVAGSKTANVTFVPDTATAGVVSLMANPISITANGSSTSALTASVKDASGNTVGAGVTVNWSTTAGSLTGTSSVTDASGIATMTLKSATTAGTATVTAAAVAGSKTASVAFVPDTATAGVVSLVANPTSIAANGSSTSTLTATVKDANGNALGAGIAVNWSTTAGSLTGTSSVTNASGVATMTLTSPTTVGVATVTAAAVAGSKTASVTFVGDPATARVVSLTPPTATAYVGGIATTYTATVKDANGFTVGAGVSVTWSVSAGTPSATSTVTNSSGQASINVVSPNVVGSGTITASAVAGSANATINYVANMNTLRVVSLSPNMNNVPANGSSTVMLLSSVRDAWGNNPGAGVTVNWSDSLGRLSAGATATDGNGTAVNYLTAPGAAGTSSVNARIAATGDGGVGTAVTWVSTFSAANVSVSTSPDMQPNANGILYVSGFITTATQSSSGTVYITGITYNNSYGSQSAYMEINGGTYWANASGLSIPWGSGGSLVIQQHEGTGMVPAVFQSVTLSLSTGQTVTLNSGSAQ
ncbi:hypothetical protein AT395_25065 (plasmid) [Pandoraea apista]|nr:hypothetical protein AT395_25065 [Pandoraea apista]